MPFVKTAAAWLAALSLLVAAAVAPGRAQAPVGEPTWLVIAQGRVVEAGPQTLVIEAAPRGIAFTDRPAREVRLLDLAAFVAAAWGEGGDFRADPPNASLLTDAGAIAVIEITAAAFDAGRLTLTVTFLEGAPPPVGDHVGITIDAFPTAVNATGGAAA